MKWFFTLSLLLLGACTVSDTYYKPYTGINNVGIVDSITTEFYYDDGTSSFSTEDFSATCGYLFGLFKISNDCSPDKIARTYNLATITEINTQWIAVLPFVTLQNTTIVGFPIETSSDVEE